MIGELPEGARRPFILWHSGMNFHDASRMVDLQKNEPKDLEPRVSEAVMPYGGTFAVKGADSPGKFRANDLF